MGESARVTELCCVPGPFSTSLAKDGIPEKPLKKRMETGDVEEAVARVPARHAEQQWVANVSPARSSSNLSSDQTWGHHRSLRYLLEESWNQNFLEDDEFMATKAWESQFFCLKEPN